MHAQVVCSVCYRRWENDNAFTMHIAKTVGHENAIGIPGPIYDQRVKERAARDFEESERRREYRQDTQASQIEKCGDLRYLDLLPITTIGNVNGWHQSQMRRAKEETLRRLSARAARPADEQGSLEECIRDIFDAHTSVTGTSIDTQFCNGLNIAAPVKRTLVDRPDSNGVAQGPRCDEHVYDVPLKSTLEALLRDDPLLVETLRSAADKWASPHPVTVYKDIPDGSCFRDHPELGPSADRSDGAVRLAFILYYDDVEVVNALGAFTGVHKLGLFYWSIINLSSGERMGLNNIHLATVALESDISYYGIEQIVSGAPNEPDDGSSIGASLRRLDRGISIRTNWHREQEETLFRGWLALVAADYPAAGLLTGTMCGATALRFCRECCIDRRTCNIYAPISFVDPEFLNTYPLRTLESYEAAKRTCGCDPKRMASHGFSSWQHAFTRIPKFNMLTGVPQDLMHVEAEGTLKCEAAALIFYCVRIGKYFTLDELNQALDKHPFPAGKRPPYFSETLIAGRKAKKVDVKVRGRGSGRGAARGRGAACGRGATGRGIAKHRTTTAAANDWSDVVAAAACAPGGILPKKGCHLHMTAADTLSFAIHSPVIFRQLGVPQDVPPLKCWLTHLDYLNICLQHKITEAEILKLDRLVQSHHTQLGNIPSYDGIWKPKNHFASHVALNIRRFGPPRHYWCMRFEALNQVFKKIAVGGSYRDTTHRCAGFFTVRAARIRKSGALDHRWSETRALQQSAVMTYYPSSEMPLAVRWLFDNMYVGLPFLSISWVESLHHHSTELLPGLSWVSVELEGTNEPASPLFGYILPNHGIISLSGQFSLFIAFYPALQELPGGESCCSWHESYKPPTAVLPLLQLKSCLALWPVSERVEDGNVVRHFVRY